MFRIENKKLENLIENSKSLKEILSKEQIIIFTKKALSLPENWQKKLEEKFIEEANFWKIDFEILKDFNESVNKKIQIFRKETFKNAEKEVNKKGDEKMEDLLSQL